MALANLPRKSQRVPANAIYPRHHHRQAYAAVVLRGAYVEAGSHGRFRVREGDVLFHGAFDAHRDMFGAEGGEILNVALPMDWLAHCASGRLDDADRLLRLAEPEVALLLMRAARPHDDRERDWPDLLADDLRRDPSLALRRWAREHGLRSETLSRGFFALYGVTPAGFRAEARARAAWQRIRGSDAALAAIAAETGFSDQPHMTRAVRALTGRSPGLWRQLRSRRAGPAVLACKA